MITNDAMILDKNEIKKIKTASSLIANHRKIMSDFSCKPNSEDYPIYKTGTIIDEDLSVKWNREEVGRLRAARENKVKELNTIKNNALKDTEQQLKDVLAKEFKLPKEEVGILWQKAYEEGHSSGLGEVYSYFVNYADMYLELLKVRNQPDKTI